MVYNKWDEEQERDRAIENHGDKMSCKMMTCERDKTHSHAEHSRDFTG